jgi:chemotaxis protein MotB
MLSNQIAQHTVSIQMGKDGLVISLREVGVFQLRMATPQPLSLPVLRQLAGALGQTPYNVRIEGHTDDVPIHNEEFDSNWELSSARAKPITRIFVNTHEIPPDRLSAAGYAEYHPVTDIGTEAGRAENRRVDWVVHPRTRVNLAMPDGDAAKGAWRKITK